MHLLFPIIFLGCSHCWFSPPGCSYPQQVAQRTIQELTLDLNSGNTLRYTVAMPPLKPGRLQPLVFALHFGGEVTPYYGGSFLNLLIEPAFQSLDAITIAPDCPGNNWTDSVSEAAVLELIDFAIRTWPVDTSRIILTGFSMGGIGCWHFAQHHPERFSAIIPLASIPPPDMYLSIPAYVIHGLNDELLPVGETEKIIRKIQERGGDVEFIPVNDLSHYQTPGYVTPLRESVKWVKKVWRK